jgi:hypothetical protein
VSLTKSSRPYLTLSTLKLCAKSVISAESIPKASDHPEEEQLFRDLWDDENQQEVVIESLKAYSARSGREDLWVFEISLEQRRLSVRREQGGSFRVLTLASEKSLPSTSVNKVVGHAGTQWTCRDLRINENRINKGNSGRTRTR